LRNEATDIYLVNKPEYFMDKTKRHLHEDTETRSPLLSKPSIVNNFPTFIYSAYLDPGPQKFLIYDPHTERVFCKTFIIDLNKKCLHPELPRPLQFDGKKFKKNVAQGNVWHKWKDATPVFIKQTTQKVFMAFQRQQNKDQEDDMNEELPAEREATPMDSEQIDKSIAMMEEHFHFFHTIHQEIISKDPDSDFVYLKERIIEYYQADEARVENIQ